MAKEKKTPREKRENAKPVPAAKAPKKPAARAASKSAAKPATKPATKLAAKPAAKPSTKPAAAPPRLERQPLPPPKPVAKPAAKAPSKPAPSRTLERQPLPPPKPAAKPAARAKAPAAKPAAAPKPGAARPVAAKLPASAVRGRAGAVRESAMLAARRRAEALRRARREDGVIGEPIDLFLELPDAKRQTPAPVLKDPASLRAAGETDKALPPSFDRTRIVLLTRDPEWVFAFWEVTNRKLDEIGTSLGVEALEDARMILRVHEVTGVAFDGRNSLSYFDVEIEGKASNWYIHVPKSDAEYCVEIGLLLVDGRLVLIARSNVTKVPPAGVSGVVDVEWGVPDRDFVNLYRIAGGAAPKAGRGGSSGGVKGEAEELSSGALPGPGVTSEELSSGAFMGPGVTSEELSSGAFMGPGVTSEELSSGAFMGPGVTSEELSSGALQGEELGSGVLAMPPGLPGRKGVEGGVKPGRGKGAPEKDDFFLWVRTELILYGGTEPDASVTVAGMPVKLRRDGTFSLRFDLPDCEMNLETHAVKWNKKHERRITPFVTRKTL